MRLFVAIEVDTTSFRDELAEICRMDCRANFVDPGIMHITLKFLGELPPGALPEIRNALDMLHGFGHFLLSMEGLGAFPSPDRPRVLWMGTVSDRLPILADRVESLLRGHGSPQRFQGHLTLARIKERCDLRKLIERYSGTKFSEFTVDSIVLKESILMPSGPIYRTVHKVGL